MRRFKLCLFLLLGMYCFAGYSFTGSVNTLNNKIYESSKLQRIELGEMSAWFSPNIRIYFGACEEIQCFQKNNCKKVIAPMEALDKVKELYATNFLKVKGEEIGEYYYKLPAADYYLVYEGLEPDKESYLMHLYEFVLDEPETGVGHTVTYGWYSLEKNTGEIKENTK